MTHHNRFEVEGNIIKNAELTYINSGTALVKFSIANEVYQGQGKKNYVSFFNFNMWGKYAERMAPRLIKGCTVFVTCQGRIESWEKDGKKVSAFKGTIGPNDVIRFTARSKEAIAKHDALRAGSQQQQQQQQTPASTPSQQSPNDLFEDDIPF